MFFVIVRPANGQSNGHTVLQVLACLIIIGMQKYKYSLT